ncbi:DUF2437 domain-containing protein [Paeniroseomonas aquatica]|uniref:DUF2437 domain-containing protein n=1 Tax=Paeniroseomonas aquatica TaxID=373043 RepID=UPI0036094BA8
MALWVRFSRDSTTGFGTLEGESIAVHSGDMLAAPSPTGETVPLAAVTLLAPVTPAPSSGSGTISTRRRRSRATPSPRCRCTS